MVYAIYCITICTISKTWKAPMEECYSGKVANWSLQMYQKKHSSIDVSHVF